MERITPGSRYGSTDPVCAREIAMFKTILACAIVLLNGGYSHAQVETAVNPTIDDSPPFYVDLLSFAAANSSETRLDLYLLVGYDQLTFISEGGEYKASYEVTVTLRDSAGQVVVEKLWTENVSTSDFNESVSPDAFSMLQRSLTVAPGEYSLVTIVRDKENKASQRMTRKVRVADFSRKLFELSDIMLVRKLSLNGERKTIVPNVSPNVGDIENAFHIFFETYNNTSAEDSVLFKATVLTEKEEPKESTEVVQFIKQGRTRVFMKINHAGLSLGNYIVEIRAYDSAGTWVGGRAKRFVIRWKGMPRALTDLNLAIDQLQYLATDKQMDYIKEATTQEEKQKRFIEFWKSKDPNPNTPRNEKMEEYYGKVEYANKNFGHYIEGWRTDMGMVYIIFGAPNNVDRHPFDIDSKPYEVWSYYDLNHQFVFVDQTGFGDFRLTTPIWEIWQRPRN